MRNPTDKNVNPNGEILAATKTIPAMAGAQSAVRIQPPMKLAAVSKAILKPGVVTDGELLEDVIVSPEAAQADMLPVTDGLAPLEAAGEGDVLLAQATGTPPPPAAGAGGFAWTPGAVGAVAGGVVVIGAAGGGSGTPTPVVPLAVSAPQRTATVYEDNDDMEEPTVVDDGDYDGLASGDLTVGGDTTTFQTPTSLEGRYGDFTFNTTTGEWTYTLDNEDPDTQALNDYRGGKFGPSEYGPGMSFPGHDYLEVTTSSGFTTVIDVEIFGNTDNLELTPLAPVTVTENEWVLIDLSGAYGEGEYLSYAYEGYNYDSNYFDDGGFYIYQAGMGQAAAMDGSSDYVYFEVQQDDFPGASGWGEVQINVNAFDGDVDGDSPELYWGFDGDYPAIHESEGYDFSTLYFFDNNDDGSTQFILVLDAYDWDDASFDLDVDVADDHGVGVYGDGTDQIALVGTASAIGSFLVEDGLHFFANDDYWDEEAGFEIEIYATNSDGQSSSTGGDFYADYYYTDYNDAPFLDVESGWGDGFFVLGNDFGANDLSFFVPAGDDINSVNSAVLGDFVNINLWDEEDTENGDGDWGYLGAYLDGDGTLSLLDDDGLISGNYVQIWAANDGDWGYWYANELTPEDLDAALNNFTSITFYGDYSQLEILGEGLHFNADEFFDVGETAELELYLTDSDERGVTTSIFLVGAEANEAPVMTVNLGQVDFEDMEVADEEEPEVNVTGFFATAFEDESINFKGFSVSDADLGDGDLLLQFGAEMEWRYDQPLFYVDAAYADLIWMPDMSEYDGYFPWGEALFLSGSAEELNAALAAGAVHFVGAPDFNGEAYIWAAVTDFGQNGYVSYDDGDFSEMSSAAEILLTVEAVEDKPIVLEEVVLDSMDDMADGAFTLSDKTLLDSGDGWYVYDAEYANEEGAELSVTAVTKLTGSGTLSGNATDGWAYTPGEGELDGETYSEFATFSYTVSDGHSSVTNMISLLVPYESAPP